MNQMVRGLHKVCHRGVSLLTPSSLSPPIFLCLKLGRVPGHLRTHSIKTTTAMTASRLHHLVPIHSVSSKNDGTNGSLSSSNAVATEDEDNLEGRYRLPPPEIREIVDAPPLPALSFSPQRDKILFLKRRALPPLEELARPEEKLAGLRIDGKCNTRSRMSFYTGIGIHQLFPDGKLGQEIEIQGFPDGAKLNFVTWSQDGKHLAFSIRIDAEDSSSSKLRVWVADVDTGKARPLFQSPDIYLNAIFDNFVWVNNSTLLVCTIPLLRGDPPKKPLVPLGPKMQSNEKRDIIQVRTFQDLLKDEYDEDLFDYYATTQLVLVSLDGTVKEIGPPAVYTSLDPSPDEKYILISSIHLEISESSGVEMDTEAELPKRSTARHKCVACYKQFKRKDHLIEHMKISYHSVHQPKCAVCQKLFKSFESLREHLTGPLSKAHCLGIFSDRGCNLCMNIFDSPSSLIKHKEACSLSAPVPFEKTLSNAESQKKISGAIDEKRTCRGPKAVAMDCEMVGGGSNGTLDLCARVCLVDEDENVIFHTYVQPQLPVTNYRYEVTGLTEEDIKNAMPLKEVKDKILEILNNGESTGRLMLDGGKARLLVGHGLEHDLDSLRMNYPDHMLRDTAKYRPLMKTNLVSHSLKYLTRTYLGYDIQSGVHDPYEDCVSVMRLYKRFCSQDHQVEEIGNQNPTGSFDSYKYKELEKMSPNELYQISKSDYRCWCLD